MVFFAALFICGTLLDFEARPTLVAWASIQPAPESSRNRSPCVTVSSVSTDQSLYQIDNEKQNDRAECGGDNRADYASAQS